VLDTLRHVRRTVAALVRTSLMSGMQYRSDFLFDSLTGAVRLAATTAPLWLVYRHTPAIQGWTVHEAGLVMALFFVMEGVVAGVVEPNLGEVVEAIRTGSLDLVLMKPADAQLLVSLRTLAPAHLWDVLAGVILGAWSLSRLPSPAPLDATIAVLLLLCGFASMYGLWLLAICASFWFVRVDNLRYLLWSVTDAGRWPITVFSGPIRWALTVAVPVAVLTSFPALAIRGRWDATLLAVAVATTLAFVVGSRIVWRRSLASYTSASS
jgi:ABC-2 type transport system permease protein